jgi:phage gpG-like protein
VGVRSVKGAYGDTHLQVETIGFGQLCKAIRDLEPKMRAEVKKQIISSAQPIALKARKYSPVLRKPAKGKKPGELRDSIKVTITRYGVAIGSNKPYSPIMEFAHKKAGGGIRRSRTSRRKRNGLFSRELVSGTSMKRDYSSVSATYGPPPRFIYRAVREQEKGVFNDIEKTISKVTDQVLDHDFRGHD